MYIEKEMRDKLDEISVHVWGSKSKWQTYLKKGIIEHSQEVHPRTRRPKSSTYKYYTVEELYELLQNLLKKMQESYVKKV